MATLTEKIGLTISKIRKQKGLTQEKLSELSGIDYSYLNLIEKGRKNPSVKKLSKIARALGTSLKDLMP